MRASDEKPNPKIFLALEAGAILLSFGVLYVGMTVAEGLQSSAAEWGAKILAVVVLAGLFSVVRRARQRDKLGRRGQASSESGSSQVSDSDAASGSEQASDAELLP